MFPYTIVFIFDGITRRYPCESYFDAVVIEDALRAKYGTASVQLWHGDVKERG